MHPHGSQISHLIALTTKPHLDRARWMDFPLFVNGEKLWGVAQEESQFVLFELAGKWWKAPKEKARGMMSVDVRRYGR